MKTIYLIVPFAPLAGAIIAGLWGRAIGRAGAPPASKTFLVPSGN